MNDRSDIYAEIDAERDRHATLGYGADHDRQHSIRHLMTYVMGYAAKGCAPSVARGEENRRPSMVKAASLIVAAIEAYDAGVR